MSPVPRERRFKTEKGHLEAQLAGNNGQEMYERDLDITNTRRILWHPNEDLL